MSWIKLTSEASGNGSGSVNLMVEANNGPLRSADATVAGRGVRFTQSGSACGAVDVTSSFSIFHGAFFGVPPLWITYTQKITLTNSGKPIPGPVYLVFLGLPRKDNGACQYGCGITPAPPITYCYAPTGSTRVLLSSGVWAPGVSKTINPQYSPGNGNPNDMFAYTPIVLSGTPNK